MCFIVLQYMNVDASHHQYNCCGSLTLRDSLLVVVGCSSLAMPKASGTRARIVVFTQGSDSTIVASDGITTEYKVDALAKDQLVDTNGK